MQVPFTQFSDLFHLYFKLLIILESFEVNYFILFLTNLHFTLSFRNLSRFIDTLFDLSQFQKSFILEHQIQLRGRIIIIQIYLNWVQSSFGFIGYWTWYELLKAMHELIDTELFLLCFHLFEIFGAHGIFQCLREFVLVILPLKGLIKKAVFFLLANKVLFGFTFVFWFNCIKVSLFQWLINTSFMETLILFVCFNVVYNQSSPASVLLSIYDGDLFRD